MSVNKSNANNIVLLTKKQKLKSEIELLKQKNRNICYNIKNFTLSRSLSNLSFNQRGYNKISDSNHDRDHPHNQDGNSGQRHNNNNKFLGYNRNMNKNANDSSKNTDIYKSGSTILSIANSSMNNTLMNNTNLYNTLSSKFLHKSLDNNFSYFAVSKEKNNTHGNFKQVYDFSKTTTNNKSN